MAKTERILYLDILKVVAVIGVIFSHLYWFIPATNDFYTTIRFFLFSIAKPAVPIFIMVTGALMLGRDISYKEIFTKRIPRVIIAFLMAAIIYTLYKGNNPISVFIRIFEGEVDGKNYDYIPYWGWYIYLLIALYIMTPFLHKMIKSFKDKDYRMFIILFVVLVSIFNCLPTFTSVFLGNSHGINGNLSTSLFSIAIGYYVFGYYISNKEISKKENSISIIVYVISMIFCTLYLLYFGRKMNDPGYFPLEYSYFPISLASMCVFISFKYYFSKCLNNNIFTKIITTISTSGFGIYLFHVPVLEEIHKLPFMMSIFNFNSILGVVVLISLVILILTIIFYLIRKIPIFRKIF